MIGMMALGKCHKKIEDHQTDDDQFFDQRVLQIIDRAIDQVRSIVGGDDLQPFGERGFDVRDLRFYALDHLLRVFAEAHDDDAADGFALAVEFTRRLAACPAQRSR